MVGVGGPPSTTGGVVFKGIVSTAGWMAVSSALILCSKRAFDDGFRFPATLTAINQLACVAGGLALGKFGVLPLREPPPLKYIASRIFPLALTNAITMVTGNGAYLHLSVSFIQMLKAFTPAVTMVVSVLMGLEKTSFMLVTSMGLVAAGGVGATLIESGTPSFHMEGFLLFLASSIAEAVRVDIAQILLGSNRLNVGEVLVYQGLPGAVMLASFALFTEANGLRNGGMALVAAKPLFYGVTFSMSFLVQLFAFLAIKYTSSLTLKVGSCFKNSALIWWGAKGGEHVTLGQVLSYLVSLLGFFLYAGARRIKNSKSPPEGKTGVKDSGVEIEGGKKQKQDDKHD
ncbi:hypothetical protein BSKO_05938 [Bryopsis sp. KO-2023]|nr:hypothetical protein BSKO_05938 [Bryopsis sp. KO-2023]